MQVSTTCRSTVNRWISEACGSRRIRSHSGSSRSRAPVSSRVSQTARRPRPDASSRTKSWRAPSGHGSGRSGLSRTSRAAVAGASSASRSAAAAAARSRSSGSWAGSASADSTTSPADRATPGASCSSWGRRGPTVEAGPASTASVRRHVSRDRCEIRRPSSRRCRWAAPASATPRPGASSAHRSGPTRSVARPATSWRTSRASSRASRHRSRSACGTSTSQVATSAFSTVASRSPPSASLRSGTDTCASSPISSCRLSTRRRSSGSRSRAVRRHWVSTRVRSRSVRLGSPARCRMSSSPSATRRSPAEASSIPETVRTEWSSLALGVPQRVPDLLGARAEVDVVVADQHHVEVGVRRQLGAPVAADRHQGGPGLGQPGGGLTRRSTGGRPRRSAPGARWRSWT